MGVGLAIGITILILIIIAFCLWYFERMLALKSSRVPGLVMPIGFFIISLVSVIRSIPVLFSQLEKIGGIGGAVATIILSFVITNIATIWVYIVYFRTRRKMGETRPWPLRAKNDSSEHEIDKNTK